MNTVIIGASDKPDRYSYKAKNMLTQHGLKSILVHPSLKEIDGQPVFNSLADVKDKIHTITVYVRPEISDQMFDEIIALKPKRVIFNPGSENPNLERKLTERGISCEEACTLVLLSTDQYK